MMNELHEGKGEYFFNLNILSDPLSLLWSNTIFKDFIQNYHFTAHPKCEGQVLRCGFSNVNWMVKNNFILFYFSFWASSICDIYANNALYYFIRTYKLWCNAICPSNILYSKVILVCVLFFSVSLLLADIFIEKC